MKTVANIIIINSQNVESEHLLTVIITSVFKEESSVFAWMSSTEVANTGLPKLLLDDLKSLKHWLAKLHVILDIYCMEYKCIQFSKAIFDAYACSYLYRYNYKEMLSNLYKSIPLAACT